MYKRLDIPSHAQNMHVGHFSEEVIFWGTSYDTRDVWKRHFKTMPPTGSDIFSLFKRLNTTEFVLSRCLTLKEMILLNI